ncbi:MAG: hypothetical protein ACXWNL_02370 [Vulcanimicrobiaceae bacterium]
MDNWDPLLIDTLAQHREVILLDNPVSDFHQEQSLETSRRWRAMRWRFSMR